MTPNSLIDRLLLALERQLGRLTIYRLPALLTAGMAFTYAMSFVPAENGQSFLSYLVFDPVKVQAGEIWRVLSFLIMPPQTNVLFFLFALWLFYIMASGLEVGWGAFRFMVYLLVGMVSTIAVSLLTGAQGTNVYLLASISLAFAVEYPNFEIRLMFLFPVQMRYLAIIFWVMLAWRAASLLLTGYLGETLMIFLTFSNYLLFLGPTHLAWLKAYRRRTGFERKAERAFAGGLHRCAVCGITDTSHPAMEFRVCSTCTGGQEYCEAHLREHPHQ